MRSVADVIGIGPGNLSRIQHEVISVNIVPITVAVVIHTRLTVQLGFIDPHIGTQVLMAVHDSLVHYGNDNRRIAGTKLPGLLAIDVGTRTNGRSKRLVSRIDIMPLLIQFGIVEGKLFGTGRLLLYPPPYLIEGHGTPVLDPADMDIVLHIGDLGNGGETGCDLLQRLLVSKAHLVPQMQSGGLARSSVLGSTVKSLSIVTPPISPSTSSKASTPERVAPERVTPCSSRPIASGWNLTSSSPQTHRGNCK